MGWREWELSDKWSHKPWWLPPYPVPAGMWPNMGPYYTHKQIRQELDEMDNTKPKVIKKRYNFFDTPDYADCHKKVFAYAVYGAKVASTVAAFDVLANRQLSYLNAFGRVGGHFGRIGGSFILYAAITCSVANLRGQVHDTYEHPWNHIIGGASVGLIWGYKFRSTGMGAGVAAAVALLGVINLRANTPTENFPTGWQLLFPDNIEDKRAENGALGGRNFGDMRVGWKIPDPGRRSLE